MLVVISPAKRLDWDVPQDDVRAPALQDQANILAGHMRQLRLDDLKSLMGLSDGLARLNRDRFRGMEAAPDASNSRPAARAFAGDTYRGLEAGTLDPDAAAYAEDHLRILSGLYGVLRPGDAIQAYRLEMGSRLKTRRGRDLYAFWGARIAERLAADAEAVGAEVLVNCASQEYFRAVDVDRLGLRIVTPLFYDMKGGRPKIVSFHAKRARGAMARFVCEHRPTEPAHLEAFDAGGYRFAPDLSEPGNPVFLRDEAA